MRVLGCLPLLLFLLLLALLPFVFGALFSTALVKLHLPPQAALWVILRILGGSGINIPVRRLARTKYVVEDPLALFGIAGWWPQFRRVRRETIIAVNVGGCLIPVGLALYETVHLMIGSRHYLFRLDLSIRVYTVVYVCFSAP